MAHRRWRGATYRPGQRWDPPWPTTAPPPPGIPAQWQSRAGQPWPFPAVRRGRRFDPPWPFVAVAPPAQPASWQHQAGRPQPASAVRRGQAWSPPWPFVAAPPPPWVPCFISARQRPRYVHPRRGHRWDAPPAVPPPTPSPWTVQGVGTRAAWTVPAPRGRRFDPPWPFTAPASPAFVPRLLGVHRAPPPWPRRGRILSVPPSLAPGPPPRFICARRRIEVRPRRGRIAAPPPFVPLSTPGVWLPGWVVAHRRPAPLPRIHGRRFDPPWPQVTPPPTRDLRVLVSAPVAKWVERGPAGKWRAGQPVAKWAVRGPTAKWRVGGPVRKWPSGPPTP